MKLDLNQAKIYKITNDYNDDIYIGSTCNTLVRRYNQHRLFSTYNKYQNIPLYKLINEIGFDRFRIQLIANYPCEDKYMLKQKEGEYIRELGTLNKNPVNEPAKVEKTIIKRNEKRSTTKEVNYYEK